ncbi:hypothetical protein V1522DRAFT_459765 [Lipomyces starkeyi]
MATAAKLILLTGSKLFVNNCRDLMAETDDEELIPPMLSITLPQLPPPSRPPSKEDVDRAEYLMKMVQGTLSCNCTVVRENTSKAQVKLAINIRRSVADALVDLGREMREGFDRLHRELGGQIREIRELKQQSTMNLELTNRLVQSLHVVIVCVVRNRELTASGQPAIEIVFLDGSTLSSQSLPPLRYFQDIQELNVNQARQYARGHGFGGTAAEIRNRLSQELGVVQAIQ